ncbi:MAG TPA: hypothetical protein VJZ04_01975 [Lachnospiraceae bacterium]|nr:hypothetical protein [Lachnospiraceae bacterium]
MDHGGHKEKGIIFSICDVKQALAVGDMNVSNESTMFNRKSRWHRGVEVTRPWQI